MREVYYAIGPVDDSFLEQSGKKQTSCTRIIPRPFFAHPASKDGALSTSWLQSTSGIACTVLQKDRWASSISQQISGSGSRLGGHLVGAAVFLLVCSQGGKGVAFFDSGLVKGCDVIPGIKPLFFCSVKPELGLVHLAGSSYNCIHQIGTLAAPFPQHSTPNCNIIASLTFYVNRK
jgi:hypothetical protein